MIPPVHCQEHVGRECHFFLVENKFKLNDKEISRINKYGDQPHCVRKTWPYHMPYCYCREQLQAPVAW